MTLTPNIINKANGKQYIFLMLYSLYIVCIISISLFIKLPSKILMTIFHSIVFSIFVIDLILSSYYIVKALQRWNKGLIHIESEKDNYTIYSSLLAICSALVIII